MTRFIPHVLNQIVGETDARFTVAQLAEIAEVSPSMMYKVINEDSELSTSKVQRLSRWLCEQGETRLARCFLSPAYEICTLAAAISNGDISDEVSDMVLATARVRKAYDRGDRAGTLEAIRETTLVCDRMKAEARRL